MKNYIVVFLFIVIIEKSWALELENCQVYSDAETTVFIQNNFLKATDSLKEAHVGIYQVKNYKGVIKSIEVKKNIDGEMILFNDVKVKEWPVYKRAVELAMDDAIDIVKTACLLSTDKSSHHKTNVSGDGREIVIDKDPSSPKKTSEKSASKQ